jgi:hypothetical protein
VLCQLSYSHRNCSIIATRFAGVRRERSAAGEMIAIPYLIVVCRHFSLRLSAIVVSRITAAAAM